MQVRYADGNVVEEKGRMDVKIWIGYRKELTRRRFAFAELKVVDLDARDVLTGRGGFPLFKSAKHVIQYDTCLSVFTAVVLQVTHLFCEVAK